MIATNHLASAAFFCPRARRPRDDYVTDLHTFLRRSDHGSTLLHHVSNLDKLWSLFADARPDIRALPNGLRDLNLLVAWSKGGSVQPVCETRAGLVALPLLLVLQLGQYFRYLEAYNLRHGEFLRQVEHVGGIHGFCGGAAAALSIACAKDEAEVVANAAVFLPIMMGLGAAMEAAGDWTSSAPTTIVVRLRYEGQGEELTKLFPNTYISAVTDPKSISIVGPAETLVCLAQHAKGLGLPVHITDITGKSHNPENADLAQEIVALLDRHPGFQMPDSTVLRTTTRSNLDGRKLDRDSVMKDLVIMILASRCEWYHLLCCVAEDLEQSGQSTHTLVVFGMDDCVPLSPFHRKKLDVSKFEARSLALLDFRPELTEIPIQAIPNLPDTAIAVIGASCRLPGANDLEEIWRLVSEQRDCHQKVPRPRFDVDESFRVFQSGDLKSMKNLYGNFINMLDFDHSFFGINAKEAANMDPQQRLLLELSYEALDASGYLATHVRERGDPVGCFVGASFVEYQDNTNAHPPTAYTATGTIRGFLCGRLSHYYGWTGPSEVIDTACSSSLVAIHRACTALLTGECKIALAGGVNALMGINNFLDLGRAGFLSSTGQCKAFDVLADGYCRAEGAGLVVLKPLKQAMSDGDDILGVIPAIATNQGGLSPTLTVPSSPALQTLYRRLLETSGFSPSHISYVEAHATGTQAGDPIEIESIREVFRDPSRKTPLYIGSIKGNLGHCEAAAGVAGLVKVLAMIQHGAIPPQANYNVLNPKIPPLEEDRLTIPRALTTWNAPVQAALVNSYGAAGSNCALLCCKISENIDEAIVENPNLLVPVILSAKSIKSLISYARAIAKYLSQRLPKLKLADVAFTLNHRRKRHKFCLEATATSLEDVVETFASAHASSLESSTKQSPVVLVFGGQNDKEVCISRAIFDAFPAFRSYIDSCDFELVKLGYTSLYPTILQAPPELNAVSQQCTLFAIQYASARCWLDAGLVVSRIIGHSLGEMTALVVSGVLSLADGIKLVAGRAHLIDTKWGKDKGAMLAVSATPSLVERVISQVRTALPEANLSIACYNASHSTVISGSSTSVDMAEHILRSDLEFWGIRFFRLSTTHAFHSTLVEPILTELDELVSKMSFKAPKLPLEFCAADDAQTIQQWSASRHAREPVFFDNTVSRVEQHLGSCVWLEAGIDTCAIPLLRKAASVNMLHTFQPLATKGHKNPCDMVGNTVLTLWRHGVTLKHWGFLSTNPKQVWLPPYQFEKTSHGIENIDRAMEAHKKTFAVSSSSPDIAGPPLRQLVKLLKSTSTGSEFLIDSQCERFQKIVGGHAVAGCPLCPASMYMELVLMAIYSLSGKYHDYDPRFENLEFLAPLGVNTNCTISIVIVSTAADTAWSFTVKSTPLQSTSKATVHCTGSFIFSRNDSLAFYARLLGGPQERLIHSEHAEKLKMPRIYSLFSRVVRYEPFLQGITSIIMDGSEALAVVQFTEGQPNREESTVWHRCDAVLLDSFISVAGVLLNSSELVSSEHVMVAGAIERTIMTTLCDATNAGPWQVYAKFTSTDAYAISDIFVYDSQQRVVAMFGGVRFTKVLLSKLRKSLSALDGLPAPTRTEPVVEKSVLVDTTPNTFDAIPEPTRQLSHVSRGSIQRANEEVRIRKVLSEYIGMEHTAIPSDVMLVDLGVDSLSSIELATDIATKFELIIDSFDLGEMTLAGLLARLGGSSSTAPTKSDTSSARNHNALLTPDVSTQDSTDTDSNSSQDSPKPITFSKPWSALTEAESEFDLVASTRGYSGYWSEVAPLQNRLLVAYIIEAFGTIGVNISSLPPGTLLPSLTHQSRHERLMQRFWEILQNHGIVQVQENGIIRGHAQPTTKTSLELHQDLLIRLPQYAPEANLMQLTGQNLAKCLQGHQDPVSLMFGNDRSSKIMKDFYHNSPMLSTSTEILVTFVRNLLRGVNTTASQPLRILEVGAGTGGTALKLADALSCAGVVSEYTFTDVSPVLVAKARSIFDKHPWMTFTTLDLEQELPHDFRSRFHIVISTNCVHATTNRATSCRRLKDALAEYGVLILSEVTQVIDWYDLCFGLLEGWWLAGNGKDYPIQPTSVWMDTLSEASFQSFGHSKGSSMESTTQQLLVGWSRGINSDQSLSPSETDYRIETLEYKNVDGIPIHADIYIPHARTKPLPIAIMVHGGGHMTLSRKYVRPAQTRHLLAHGFLPVSLDFRLCPEVNLIDGPMADVRDGYRWAQECLPQELMNLGVAVDASRIVAIGWSTGGHLALSLAWTLAAGIPPPTAILSFYAPVNFDSEEIYRDCGTTLSSPSKSVQQIIKTLPRKPITTYTPTRADENNRFWLQPGDTRSDLLISIFKDGMGLPLFLNGLPEDMDSDEGIGMPSEDRIAAIDPLAQLRRGQYKTPTCVVHPVKDNIAPYSAAARFVDELKARGMKHRFLSPEGVGHAFDVNLQKGEDEWEKFVKPAYEFLFECV